MTTVSSETNVQALEAANLLQIYRRPNVVFERGDGVYLFDTAGRRYLDFVSGVGVPDWVVMTPDLLTKGAAGVKGAGFFGNDWTVESGEAVVPA